MHVRRLVVLAAFLALLLPAAVQASRMRSPRPDLQLAIMTHEADTIVVAEVVRSTGVDLPDWGVTTRHEVVVHQSWKGRASAGDTIEIWTAGGHVQGSRIEVRSGDPARLSSGHRYVLFVARWSGRLGVREGPMGALEVTDGRVNGYITEGARELSWLRERVKIAIAAP